jgi:hypothetical protein
MLDGARALLAVGADPAAKLVMRHEGQDYDALRSTVGAAAKLRVKDSTTGAPIFASWRPWTAEQTGRVSPPMRRKEEAGVCSGSRQSLLYGAWGLLG